MSTVRLVAFDGDDTLWTPLDGVCISDRTPTDDVGRPDFSYEKTLGDPRVIRREDGPRFVLRPEAREVLGELRRRKVLSGVVSYNHEANVVGVLKAFGISRLVDYTVAEWHTNKGEMLNKMIWLANRDGYHLKADNVMLVDDDPWDLYKAQCLSLGVQFRKFGVEVANLQELVQLLDETAAG